jgi:uncharacterized protein YndB with AHSA1/START domain
MTFERRTRQPAARLWRALTEPDEVAKWMGYPARVDLRVGGDWHVEFTSRGEDEDLAGVIVRVEPERRLACVWGMSVLEWRLEPDGDGCRYTFVHHGQAPRLVDEEVGLVAGWHSFLDDLEGHLEGREARDAGFSTLKEAYRERVAAALA